VFGTVEQATVDESEESGIGIHQYNNFGSFPGAIALMLRVITGENWQDVMLNCLGGHACENSTGLAQPDVTCGSDFAYFFFPLFYFISTIMVGLVFSWEIREELMREGKKRGEKRRRAGRRGN
jgi:hypothetical protein